MLWTADPNIHTPRGDPMRRISIILLLLVTMSPIISVPRAGAATYGNSDAQDAMDMAYYLSLLEESGSFNALYDLIHPDARAFIPREAVVGWFANEFGPRGPSAAVIHSVKFLGWRWPVTGEYYAYTAEVSFTQYFWDGGANNRLNDVVRLVQDDAGTWRWFFGRSMEFVQRNIDTYVTTNSFDSGDFLNSAAADIDGFWSSLFRESGERYRSPALVFFDQYSTSACVGEVSFAAYCGADQTVYIDEYASGSWALQYGDFAWVTIVAHEWGHHVVGQLVGSGEITRFDANNGRYQEAMADCFAGVYAQDAGARGLLDPGDITEAVQASIDAGGGTIHGTGEERMLRFMVGFFGGLVGCGIEM